MSKSIALVLAGLLTAASLAACSKSGATPASTTAGQPTSAGQQSIEATLTGQQEPASTPTQAPLQPPAAPTNLIQMMAQNPDDPGAVEADYSWTPPPGPIDGYYFLVQGNYADATPRLTCGPDWQRLSASATAYQIASVQSEGPTYICAFNAAGTSPTVEFEIRYGPGIPTPPPD